jgi:hypothetical protein
MPFPSGHDPLLLMTACRPFKGLLVHPIAPTKGAPLFAFARSWGIIAKAAPRRAPNRMRKQK